MMDPKTFEYDRPLVSDGEVAATIVRISSTDADAVTPVCVGEILSLFGRLEVGGYVSPPDLVEWLVRVVPAPILVLARVAAEAEIANAAHLPPEKVKAAVFAIVGYSMLGGRP